MLLGKKVTLSSYKKDNWQPSPKCGDLAQLWTWNNDVCHCRCKTIKIVTHPMF